MDAAVYKLLTLEEWSEFERDGHFQGAPIDRQDGYIHLSTAAHVRETARLHFKNTGDIKLVEVLTRDISGQLKYEASRGGILFPHLYGDMSMDHVGRIWHLTRGPSGLYEFPEDVG